MAGSETTSQTLSYAIWELAKNPKIQDKLREEIMTFPSGLSYDDINEKTPYLAAVCKEVSVAFPS